MSPRHLKLLYLRSDKTSSSANLLLLQGSPSVSGSTIHPVPQTETWGLSSPSSLPYSPHPIAGQALSLLPLEPPFSPSFSAQLSLLLTWINATFFLNTHIRHLLWKVFLASLHPSVWAPVSSLCLLCPPLSALILSPNGMFTFVSCPSAL